MVTHVIDLAAAREKRRARAASEPSPKSPHAIATATCARCGATHLANLEASGLPQECLVCACPLTAWGLRGHGAT